MNTDRIFGDWQDDYKDGVSPRFLNRPLEGGQDALFHFSEAKYSWYKWWMMSSDHNARVALYSSWSDIPVSRVFGQRSTELCGGFPPSMSQLLHTSGHFQQHDISVRRTVQFEWNSMSFPIFPLDINTNYFDPKTR